MKMSIKYISCFLQMVVLLNITACSDLNETVYSDITENTYNYEAGDATKVVGSSYANLRSFVGFYTYYMQEICTDELVQPANSAGWDDGGVFRRMHLHTWNAEQTHVADYWNACYTGILLSNRAIHKISRESFPIDSNESRVALIAEARTLRAYYYWYVLDNFGDAPFLTEPTSELVGKTPRKELYDFVVRELLECMDKLPEKKDISNYGRFTKWGAKALLANVYLNAEVYSGTSQWEACINQCDDIMKSGEYQFDVNYLDPFKVHNENSLENIFVITFDFIYARGFEIYKAALHAANQATYNLQDSPWGPGSVKAPPQFINTYDIDDERLEKTWLKGVQYAMNGSVLKGSYDMLGKPLEFVNSMPDGVFTGEADGYRSVKYEIEVAGRAFMSNDFVVFRLTQVYMMKAECLLRTGDANGAAELVTLVRERAFRKNPQKTKVTGDELIQASRYVYGVVNKYILTPQAGVYPEKFGRFYDELGWEFVGETMRRRDMIRFGHFTKVQWLSHLPNGDYRTLFPIPQKEVDANQKLEQNPSYIQ